MHNAGWFYYWADKAAERPQILQFYLQINNYGKITSWTQNSHSTDLKTRTKALKSFRSHMYSSVQNYK